MDASNAVDGMRANNAQVAHVDSLHAVLLDHRHATNSVHVARKLGLHIFQVSIIDLIDDLQVSRQNDAQTTNGPSLQCLGQQSVIGVRAGSGREVPRLVPREALGVDQDAHELGYGQRRMRVV